MITLDAITDDVELVLVDAVISRDVILEQLVMKHSTAIKRALDEAGIDISFPQVEVSLRRPSEAGDDGASGSS